LEDKIYSADDFESIVKGEYQYGKHKKICEERWNEKTKIILTNEKIIMDNEINWNYIKNYQLGYLLDFPLIENIESKNRLLEFASICMSEKAPLSQGYYFIEDINVMRFIRGVVIQYLLDDLSHFGKTWYHIDSEIIVDKIKSNEIMNYSFNEHEILFIVNSYNRYCHSKKHRILYRIINDIMAERERENKKTFILSLTSDVGPEKGPEHGFPIPMFLIKEKINEVQEAKATGENLWKNSHYKKLRKTQVFFNTPSFSQIRKMRKN
jgi:hypothetical protein